MRSRLESVIEIAGIRERVERRGAVLVPSHGGYVLEASETFSSQTLIGLLKTTPYATCVFSSNQGCAAGTEERGRWAKCAARGFAVVLGYSWSGWRRLADKLWRSRTLSTAEWKQEGTVLGGVKQ